MKISRVVFFGSMSLIACGEPLAESPLPPAPDAVVSTAALGEIVVSWRDVSTKESRYEVEFATVPNVWQPLKTTNADVTTVHHPNVEFETTYYYRVRACNSDGCSAWVTTSTAWKFGEPPLANQPIITNIGLTFANLISVIDHGMIRTEVYFIFYDPQEGVAKGVQTDKMIFSPLDGGTGRIRQAALPVIGLREGTTYAVVAVATNPAGSVTSAPAIFTTSRTGMPALSLLATTLVTATSAVIAGTIDPGGSTTSFFYQLAAADSSFASGRTLNANAPTILNPIVTRASVQATGLRPATTYKWRMVASNSLGTVQSDSVLFTTFPQ